MNSILVIAKATLRGLVRERIFHAAVVLNILFLCFSAFLSTLTFVEQRKILLDFGFAAASLVGVGFAVFLGGSFIRKELDNRTLYAVLAKPVSRTQYLLGKIAGGAAVISGLTVINFTTVAIATRFVDADIPRGFVAVAYLSLLESILFLVISAAISMACSTLFLGITLSFAVFLVGRSGFALHQIAEKSKGAVKVLLEVCYFVFPAAQRFDIRDLVAYGRDFPAGILGVSTVYFFAYCLFVIMVMAMLFRRKDLP